MSQEEKKQEVAAANGAETEVDDVYRARRCVKAPAGLEIVVDKIVKYEGCNKVREGCVCGSWGGRVVP